MTIWQPDLDSVSGPRYLAIVDALADDLDNGRLHAGDRLPTHRDLAYRLGVTVGTVTRAYAEAERRGLITADGGRGNLLDYHHYRGRADHRAAGAEWVKRHGLSVSPEQIVITAGGQHG